MYDPNDDTDVTSGTTDGAQMERTSPPVRIHSVVASVVHLAVALSATEVVT